MFNIKRKASVFFVLVLLLCIGKGCYAGHCTLKFEQNRGSFGDSELIQFDHIKKCMDQAFNRSNTFTSIAEFLSEIREFKTQGKAHVLGLLDECHCDNFDRRRHPGIRGSFEYFLLSEIKRVFADKNGVVNITILGSGRLFDTLVILNKLIEGGFFNIQVNLVDNLYIPCFVKAYDKTKCYLSFCELNRMFSQFLHWFSYLKKYYISKLNIECNIYDNVDEYGLQINHGEISRCDILIASDFSPKPLEPFLTALHKNLLSRDGVYGYLVEGEFEEFNKLLSLPLFSITHEKTGRKLHDPLFAYVGVKN